MWFDDEEFTQWLDDENLGTEKEPLDDYIIELMYRAWMESANLSAALYNDA